MDSVEDIFKNLEGMTKEVKLRFYDRLGFHLTLAIRSICSNPETSDKEKVEAIKIINELSHSIFNWTWILENDDKDFDDLKCFAEIKYYAEQSKIVPGELTEAIKSSYRLLTKN